MKFNIDKMYCGAIRRGDVFVYDDKGEEKIVLVLQEDVLNQGLPTVVCAIVVPYEKGDRVFENEVLLKGKEIGFDNDGICMLHKIITIDRRGLIAKKAELENKKFKEVSKALDINLGRFRD